MQLNLDDSELVKLFSISTIFSVLTALGHTEFSFNDSLFEQITGVAKEDIIPNQNAPKDALDIFYGQKKFALTDDIFKPFLMVKEKDMETLSLFIAEQQAYIAENVEILGQ